MSDWWDDFTNNLATDLAPLIALFGEAPTKQYLSECLNLTDIVIFAMAPLGIITILVSAIRVCGTPSLRAFIGRAKEGLGNVEAELCSSTSREVCELYNNGAIARVFGRPKLLEIVHDEKVSGEDFHHEGPEAPASAGIYLFEEYLKKPGQEWKEIGKKRSKTDDENVHLQYNNQRAISSSPGTAQLNFAPNPNLSLNVGIKERRKPWFALAAILGISLQSGVLVWAAVARFKLRLVRGDSQDKYAVPMTIIGTILLCAGVALCAHLIERSTKERVFERREECTKSRVYWVQPGTQFVGDQAFDSFAYTHPKNKFTRYITSWKDKENEPDRIWVWIGITSTAVGFITQFLGLRACHSSVAVAQLGVTIFMSVVRSMLRTQRLEEEEVSLASRPEAYEGRELDWLALNIGNINLPEREFVRRWEISDTRRYYPGHFYAETRKLLDDNAAPPIKSQKMRLIAPDTEIRKLTAFQAKQPLLLGFQIGRGSNKRSKGNNGQPLENPWDVEFDTAKWPHIEPELEESHVQIAIEKYLEIESVQKAAEKYRTDVQSVPERWRTAIQSKSAIIKNLDRRPSEILKVFMQRARLTRLTSSWDDRLVAARSLARSLAQAIEATVRILFTADVVFEQGWNEVFTMFWVVRCSLVDVMAPGSQGKNQMAEENIYLALRRKIDMDGRSEGTWRVDESELEAVLGLWLWSLRGADEKGRLSTPLRRILSAKSDSADSTDPMLDFNLWRETGGFGITETKSPPRDSHGRRLFGWQNVPANKTADVTVLELPVMTKCLSTMCAQEIYALFFTSILCIIKNIGGKTEVLQGRGFSLTNTNISRIQDAFTESGLGSIEDAFTCIFPALRIQKKLPEVLGTLTSARETAESYLLEHRWEEAEQLLQWALQHCMPSKTAHGSAEGDNRQNQLSSHERLLVLALCECYRKALFRDEKLEFGWKGILNMLKTNSLGTRKQATLITSEETPKYNLTSTIRCYGEVALRVATERLHEEAIRQLGSEIQKGAENLHIIVERSTPNPESPGLCKEPERCLSRAAKLGDMSATLFLLGQNLTTAECEQHKSALIWSAQRGWYAVVKSLIDRGAFLELKDAHGRSGISHAAESGDFDTFNYLLSKGSFPNFVDIDRRTPLSYAAQCGSSAIVAKLLADGRVEPETKDKDGRTPLHIAARHGHEKVIELLLGKQGVELNPVDGNGRIPLHMAAEGGDERSVNLLLAHESAEVNMRDGSGCTPLHLAAECGHQKVVELLLAKQRVEVSPADKSGQTPLHVAAKCGFEEIVKLLLAKEGVQKNAVDDKKRTPLHKAAECGREKVVRLLLGQEGVDVCPVDKDGRTPLHMAAEYGHEEIVNLFLTKPGVEKNSVDKLEQTPLHLAAERGHAKVVRLLLGQKDVEASLFGTGKLSPLELAAAEGHEEVVELLLAKQDVEINSLNKSGRALLHRAARGGHEKVVSLLLSQKGVDVNLPDVFGSTPLHLAAEGGREKVMKVLLAQKGVEVNKLDSRGRTPLQEAAALRDNEKVVEMLLAKEGVEFNTVDSEGYTPLHWAIAREHRKVVRVLLAKEGLDINVKDQNGETPLDLARFKRRFTGRPEVEELLLAKGAVGTKKT